VSRVPRRLAVVTAVGCCLAAAALPALAEPEVTGSPGSATVSTTVGQASSRQLALLDLAGQPLQSLDLRAGAPSPFRVQVTDSGIDQLTSATAGFTVESVLNNLYLDGDPTQSFIASGDVAVGFPVGGAQNAVGSLVALPRTVVEGTLPSCASLFGTLASLAALSPLTGAGLSLCDAVGSGLTVPATEVLVSAEQTLTDLADVPFSLSGQESGAYTLPDFTSGIGAGADGGVGAAGTARTLLSGVPNLSSGLQAELDALVAALDALPVTSPTGTGAQTAVDDVIGVLLATPATAELGSALAGLTPEQAGDVVNLLTGTVQQIGLGDLLSVAGVYNSFPVLTATPSGTPTQGTYSGTLTVTLVQP
jgi:hypothetical protein